MKSKEDRWVKRLRNGDSDLVFIKPEIESKNELQIPISNSKKAIRFMDNTLTPKSNNTLSPKIFRFKNIKSAMIGRQQEIMPISPPKEWFMKK